MVAIERTALERSEERLRLLVENVLDYGIFMLTPDGVIDSWNAGASRLKGYAREEILGKHFSIFYPAADVAAGKCEGELAAATRDGHFEDEGWRVRKDGSLFWANVVITPLRDNAGTLVGFAKVTRDLTERKRAEEEAQRFKTLVESVKDYGIFLLSPAGFVDSWNEGAKQLKGYTIDEILGKHFSIFYPAEDVTSGKCERELDIATRVGRFEDEGWRLRKDGSRFWANVIITALTNANGKLMGFAKVTRDLTERRHAEERLRTLAAEKAVLAEKARVHEFQERFVAILGHDLRGPLAAIDMAATLLSRQPRWDASTARLVERIATSSGRMTKMIEQILDLTRTRLGEGFVIKPTPVDLDALLDDVISEVTTAQPERRISLRCPPVGGLWDKDRLDQVFSNLVGNALQHGDPAKPISVTARASSTEAVVFVHNHGRAIPSADLERIFDPFRRAAATQVSAAAADDGLGLGLYIAREIVRAHGGDIVCESSAIDGTTFRVSLPLRANAPRLVR